MKKVSLIFILTMAIASIASAQATRTWISGVGDDVNPCSRTAPCKTFAGAISKTAPGGIINCLDPGGFGAVTITKSMTFDCTATLGSMLSSGTFAITVNAQPTDKIVLRGLDLNGAGATLGTNAINIVQAASVSVYNCRIANYSNAGILVSNSSNNINVLVSGSQIVNVNNAGILVLNSGGADKLDVIDTTITGIGNVGIDVSGALGSAALTRTTITHCTNAAFQVENGTSNALLESTVLSFSGTGIVAGLGASTPTIRLARCSITGNATGISGGGTTACFSSNLVAGNVGGNACSAPNTAQQ
jgi:Right handed beta helix region